MSENLITVEVTALSSVVFISPNNIVGGNASGLVKVELADNTEIIPQDSAEVEIFYSVSNVGADERRKNLANMDGEGGYTFQMSTTLDAIPNAREVIEQILLDWQNATCVNFKLSEETIDNPPSSPMKDGINIIDWTNNLTSGVLMKTFTHLDVINFNANGVLAAWAHDIDISIGSQYDWYVGLSPISDTTKYDFYAALSHEVGHAHQLNHVLGEQSPNVSKLMNPFRGKGFETRIVGNSATDGGNDIMDNNFIELVSNPNNPIASPMERIEGCLNPIRNVSYNPDIEMLLFPNPVTNEFVMQTNLPSFMDSHITIFDITGKPILLFNDLKIASGLENNILTIKDLPKGIYILLFETEIGFTTKKIVKK